MNLQFTVLPQYAAAPENLFSTVSPKKQTFQNKATFFTLMTRWHNLAITGKKKNPTELIHDSLKLPMFSPLCLKKQCTEPPFFAESTVIDILLWYDEQNNYSFMMTVVISLFSQMGFTHTTFTWPTATSMSTCHNTGMDACMTANDKVLLCWSHCWLSQMPCDFIFENLLWIWALHCPCHRDLWLSYKDHKRKK